MPSSGNRTTWTNRVELTVFPGEWLTPFPERAAGSAGSVSLGQQQACSAVVAVGSGAVAFEKDPGSLFDDDAQHFLDGNAGCFGCFLEAQFKVFGYGDWSQHFVTTTGSEVSACGRFRHIGGGVRFLLL